MTRTRSGKTLPELLVIVVVLLGLAGMLAHAVKKDRAASGYTQNQVEHSRDRVAVCLNTAQVP